MLRPRIVPVVAILVVGAAILVYQFALPPHSTTGPGPAQSAWAFPPADEAASDPEFLAFRGDFLFALDNLLTDELVAVADENVLLDFGGYRGRETFREFLLLHEVGDNNSYWHSLRRAVVLGGVFLTPDVFCTPYMACRDIPGCAEIEGCEAATTLVAVTSSVPVHAGPDAGSQEVARLSYEFVQLTPDAPYRHFPWIEVRLADGRTGFVTGPDMRSQHDYRVFFERGDAGWRMTAFIAGE